MSSKKTEPSGPQPGNSFETYQAGSVPIKEVRNLIRRLTGLEPHIKVKFGPTTLEIKEGRTVINCPVTAIDDEYLQGEFRSSLPAVGYCLYIGYFKKK